MGEADGPSMTVIRDCGKTAAHWAQRMAGFDLLSKSPEEFKMMRLI